jgi:hypothetical protein
MPGSTSVLVSRSVVAGLLGWLSQLSLHPQAAPAGGRFAAVLAAEDRGTRVARNPSPPQHGPPCTPARLPFQQDSREMRDRE